MTKKPILLCETFLVVAAPEVEVISCQVGGKDPEAFSFFTMKKHCYYTREKCIVHRSKT